MEPRPFAGFNPRPSAWGYNWTTESIPATKDNRVPSVVKKNSQNVVNSNSTDPTSPEPHILAQQYANMPAALLTSMKRDKKPFTYTPGGVNLSEVLNARLQKRIERKKKYCEEKMADENRMASHPIERLPKFDPPKQMIVMPTYNTPLDMYSMENALEALEVQAELVAADKSLSSGPCRSATLPRNHKFDERDFDPNKGVTQSKAFRVLQIITDTDEDPNEKGKGSNFQDEMRFTGLRDNKTIPSKFFQTLQKITGTEEEEEENETETARTSIFEKQPTRTGFQPQQRQQTAPAQSQAMQNHVTSSQFQTQKQVHFQDQATNSPGLRRPASFLPMKTGGDPLTRVKPVHPPFLTNGPRNVFNSSGGTNF